MLVQPTSNGGAEESNKVANSIFGKYPNTRKFANKLNKEIFLKDGRIFSHANVSCAMFEIPSTIFTMPNNNQIKGSTRMEV